VKGVELPEGRLFEIPYQFEAASRSIRCSPRTCAFCWAIARASCFVFVFCSRFQLCSWDSSSASVFIGVPLAKHGPAERLTDTIPTSKITFNRPDIKFTSKLPQWDVRSLCRHCRGGKRHSLLRLVAKCRLRRMRAAIVLLCSRFQDVPVRRTIPRRTPCHSERSEESALPA
jgi:hypothetical protein